MTHQDVDGQVPSDDLVWYASYGSNLSLGRFTRYILGDKRHRGARDRSLPRAQRKLLLDATLFFGGHSTVWGGGGIAYIDPDDASDRPTLARAYLIARSQFEDVCCQENGVTDQLLELARLGRHEEEAVLDGPYGRVMLTGHMEGVPILTFTSPVRLGDMALARPSPAYLRVIAAGLSETFEFSVRDAARYLSSKPGIAGQYSLDELMRCLSPTS